MTYTHPDVGGPKRMWLIALAVMVLCLVACGYLYNRSETERIRQDKYDGLHAIGEMKANEIAHWRSQRLFDIAKIARSPILKKATAALLREPSNPSLIAEMRERLRLEQEGETYADALLFGPDGRLLLSARDVPDPLSPATRNAMAAALENHGAVFADPYRCPRGVIHVDVAQPMYDAERVPLVVVVLRSDAGAYLYPLVQSWPTPSRSAETLLVRRQGNEVVFLNELRHRPETALSLRFPLSRTDLPAVQAVLGKQGLFLGSDYRGVEVLADLRPVAESNWFLVAKVDTDEILVEAHYRAKMISLFVALAVLLAAATTTIAYRRRQTSLLQKLYETERQRREIKEELRTAFYCIGDAVMTTDNQGRVRHLNPVAERLTGWTEAQARGQPLNEVFHIVSEETRANVESPVERVLREGTIVGLANHTLLLARDGRELPIADSGSPIRTGTGEIKGVVLVFRDQTEERAAQTALLESERKFRDTVRYLDEGYYSCTVDGVLLEHNLAFNRILGFDPAEDLRGSKLPDFWQDKEDRKKYLDELTSKSSVRNFLINAKTIAGDRLVVMANSHLVKDADGNPLRIEGTFTDFTERKRMEEALRDGEERFSVIHDKAPFAIALTQVPDAVIVSVNDAFLRLFEFTREEVIGKTSVELGISDPGTHAQVSREFGQRASVRDFEARRRTHSGREVVVLINVNQVAIGGQSFALTTVQDVTERKRAEDALRESEELFRSLFDSMLNGFAHCRMLFDQGRPVDFVYLKVNSAFETQTGLKNVVGRKVSEVIPGIRESSLDLFETYGRVALTGVPETFETYVQALDMWFSIAAYSPKREYFVAVFDVITDRKRAEAALRDSEQRLRRFYDSGLLGVIFWDMSGRIVEANDKFLEMVGFTRGDLTSGQIDWLNMTPPEFRQLDEDSIAELKATGVNKKPFEKEYIRRDGTRIPISVAGAMLDDERTNGVAFVLDITERRAAEEGLRKLNAELEQRVRDRTAALQELNRELEAFSYSVSHDLRAPLRAIDGFTRILVDDYGSHLDDEGKRVCSVIRENTGKMGRLIDDLLSFSRLGRTEMQPSHIDMRGMAFAVFHEITTLEHRARIDFQLEALPSVVGDPSLMRQVWTNLLGNAVKFSSKRERAVITVTSEIRDVEFVFKISDNGAGFDMQYVSKLFGVFQRLHTTKQFEGTGVGLALVQRVIHRHGGRIWAEGEPDRGATFYFALPSKGT